MRSDIAEELERLRDGDGLLRLETIVTVASDPTSPLHEHFEWDDAKAAHSFRVDQARQLVRQMKIPLKVGVHIVRAPAYVPAVSTRNAYERVDEVEPGSDKAHVIIMNELTRVSGILGRARKIAAILHVEHEIDGLLSALTDVSARLEGERTDA